MEGIDRIRDKLTNDEWAYVLGIVNEAATLILPQQEFHVEVQNILSRQAAKIMLVKDLTKAEIEKNTAELARCFVRLGAAIAGSLMALGSRHEEGEVGTQ